MSDQFEWKAEITFKGTADEFNKMADSVGRLRESGHINVSIPEWGRIKPQHLAGCMRIPIDIIFDPPKLNAIIDGQKKIQVKQLTDIAGGIRTPHLHIGEEVVLLDRSQFKTVVADIAHALASKRADAIKDYTGVMINVGDLANDF
jgi:hypothetical protein